VGGGSCSFPLSFTCGDGEDSFSSPLFFAEREENLLGKLLAIFFSPFSLIEEDGVTDSRNKIFSALVVSFFFL